MKYGIRMIEGEGRKRKGTTGRVKVGEKGSYLQQEAPPTCVSPQVAVTTLLPP